MISTPKFILFLIASSPTAAYEVLLGTAGYNYYSQLILENNLLTYNTIIDTGNPTPLLLREKSSLIYNLSAAAIAKAPKCFTLTEDNNFNIYFQALVPYKGENKSANCPIVTGHVLFGSYNQTVNYTLFSGFKFSNPILHNWTLADGDIGMAYCGQGTSCVFSMFQNVLLYISNKLTEFELFGAYSYSSPVLNTTSSTVFGLDLNSEREDHKNSTMQLGSLKLDYSDSIVWSPIQTSTPLYHSAMIQNVTMCGINLFHNWSFTWPFLVDTGSVCLSLPGEIYTSLYAWLNTTDVQSAADLPSLSFSLSDVSPNANTKNNKFYIPLENLLLPGNNTLPGNPIVLINGQHHQLCIVQMNSIFSGDTVTNTLNAPTIIIGTKVLESIYFAADYTSGHVGFASKLSSEKESYYDSMSSYKQCSVKTQCKGDQRFIYNYNSCTSPSCSHYFFVEVDPVTQTCRWNTSAIGAGLFFIVAILLVEVGSFFIFQSTTYDFLMRGEDNDDDDARALKLADAKRIDIFTRSLGRLLCNIVDFILINVLGLAGRQN